MKKIIGIILTIVSFLMNSYGVLLLAVSEFDNMKAFQKNELKTAGFLVLLISIALFIVGLFLIASKSRKYRKMEMELSNLKFTQGKEL
ncbi:hypothetical protein [Kordia sp.]|uniref:hypothetical protein n=1 Tax=Kordia sp. TaxID=1965332 RepID=UPI003B5BB15F